MTIMSSAIKFYANQLPNVSAVGKITLKKPRIHVNQIAHINYLIFVLKGTFYVSEEDRHYAVKEGQVFFRQSGKHHYSQTYMPVGTTWFWVSFSYDTLGKTVRESCPDIPCYALPQLTTMSNQQHLFQKLESMYHLYHASNPYKIPHLAAELTSIFYTILANPPHHHSGSEMLVEKVNELLMLQLHSTFDAHKIAAKINMDYSYIGKCYKAQTGTTINHHFNSLKIQKAIAYMEDGSMNISQMSEVLGYPNPYYFSRVFKKFTSLSPSAFMKQMPLQQD